MKNNKMNKGISILGILFLGVLIILILSYFKISIRSVVESPIGQENINYVTVGTRNLWDEYLKEPTTYLLKKISTNFPWNSK